MISLDSFLMRTLIIIEATAQIRLDFKSLYNILSAMASKNSKTLFSEILCWVLIQQPESDCVSEPDDGS